MLKQLLRLITVATIFCFPLVVEAETKSQLLETNGSIGFTGVYEPIGTPDPTPPESIVRPPITEVAKPAGTLPKTNEIVNSWLIWLGGLLISFVFLLWKRNRKQIQN